MAETFIAVANTDQPQVWFNLTNSLANFATNRTVSANSTCGMTTGNGFVIGILGANNLVATSLSGGNTTVSANLVVTSNCQFQSGFSLATTTYLSVNAATSGTNSQIIDYVPFSTFRSAEYTLTVKNAIANAYQMSKLLLIHDGGNAYVTEYGVLSTNGNQGVFSATSNATAAILNFTPISTSTTIQGSRLSTSV